MENYRIGLYEKAMPDVLTWRDKLLCARECGYDFVEISCDSGVYQFIPPEAPGREWEIRQLISDASSDAVLLDFDGDGETELGSITPFHGDTLRVYKKNAVGVARELMSAFAKKGADGVYDRLMFLNDELLGTMAKTHCATVSEIGPGAIRMRTGW